MRRWIRAVVVLSLLAGVVYALRRARQGAEPVVALPADPVRIPPRVEPAPPVTNGASAGTEPWVTPEGGVCPVSHPVKGKLASGIFHVPGGLSYDRTRADRCYLDADAATADGLRAAKR